jgi:hypothetical protein
MGPRETVAILPGILNMQIAPKAPVVSKLTASVPVVTPVATDYSEKCECRV